MDFFIANLLSFFDFVENCVLHSQRRTSGLDDITSAASRKYSEGSRVDLTVSWPRTIIKSQKFLMVLNLRRASAT